MSVNWSKVQLSLRPANSEETSVALEFQKLWARTREVGKDLGWNVSAGSRVQLYFQWNDGSAASEIFVSPSQRDRFVFRVTPTIGALASIRDALRPVASSLSGAEIATEQVTRTKGVKLDVVEVRSTWEDVIGDDSPSSETVATRLHDFVVPLLRAIPKK